MEMVRAAPSDVSVIENGGRILKEDDLPTDINNELTRP